MTAAHALFVDQKNPSKWAGSKYKEIEGILTAENKNAIFFIAIRTPNSNSRPANNSVIKSIYHFTSLSSVTMVLFWCFCAYYAIFIYELREVENRTL